MAISEKSYRDRQAKAQSLHDATAGFAPAFAPADGSLSATNFQAFIDGVGSRNTTVENLEVNYTNNATARVELVKSIRAAVTQAVGFVKSNKAWATQFKAVKMAADKLRGVNPPSKVELPVPPAAGGPPVTPERPRSKGEQAYVELAAHLDKFITAITACAPYTPPSAAITLSAFGGMVSQFKGLNAFISTLEMQLTSARESRRKLYYEGEECLERKFQAVKDSVKGQYGQASAEYGGVKALTW